MKVLFITKRRTSEKDMILERFGRYFHLPVGLGARGHDVLVVAADYREPTSEDTAVDGIRIVSLPLSVWTIGGYLRAVRSVAQSQEPDVVVGGGDTQFGWVARRTALDRGVPFVFDVFDNYLAFKSARVPGMRRSYRKLLAEADLVVGVSRALTNMAPHDRVSIVPNGVDMDLFRPAVRSGGADEVRIGYVGGVTAGRGIETLAEAVAIMRRRGRSVRLVLAGPAARGYSVPTDAWVDYLGSVTQSQVPELIGSLDVAVLPYPNSAWASYTSPYKLLEYLACEVPVVVTDVSEFGALAASDQAVCRPDDSGDMARAIEYQLANQVVVPRNDQWSWSSRASALEEALKPLCRAGRAP